MKLASPPYADGFKTREKRQLAGGKLPARLNTENDITGMFKDPFFVFSFWFFITEWLCT